MESMKNEIESLLRLTVHLEKKIEDTKDQAGSFEELRDALIKQAEFYREENAKMEAVLKKLQLLRHELNPLPQIGLEKLTALQEKNDGNQCNSEAIGLSHADRLRKQNNYVTKIKSCIKVHNTFIEKLAKEIKIAKGEFDRSEKRIASLTTVSSDELELLQMKIERYEKELLKFEKKYPWLSDAQFNLQNISKETDALNNLRYEKVKLLQELDVYQCLKPDMNRAIEQHEDLKLKYNSIK